MSTRGYVTEFDATPTRAQGVLRWIARCSMYDEGPAERLVPRIMELKRSAHRVDEWSIYEWTRRLGLSGGEVNPGSHVRRALILAGDTSFDQGPMLYRWDFDRGRYVLSPAEVRG
jgi:hypothetical protein